MRLWSLHPRYLDASGLVALWREALLAQAVLHDETRGYRHHPQLRRFLDSASPRGAIATYLRGVHAESLERGYSFAADRIRRSRTAARLTVSRGQLEYEWEHLMAKLRRRAPTRLPAMRRVARPDAHPLFRVVRGGVAEWEKR